MFRQIIALICSLNLIILSGMASAQQYPYTPSSNSTPTGASYGSLVYQPSVAAPSRTQLQQKVKNQVSDVSQDPFFAANSAEEVESIYATRLSALLDTYDEVDARTRYADLSQVVEDIHALTKQYESQKKFYQKLSAPPAPAAAETTYRQGSSKQSLNVLLGAVDKEETDSMDLVELIDAIASTKDGNGRAMQVTYASEIFLQSLESITEQEARGLSDFLPRLYARAAYRLKHRNQENRNADIDIMQRSTLRMLLHKVSDVCARAQGGCPRTNGYFSSFLQDIEEFKKNPSDLNLVMEYTARYAVFNLRSPDKLAAVVDKLEKKPGRRPTHFETTYSSAIGALMYALVEAVAQVPQDKETLEKAKNFLISMAGASHATDTRVFAIGAATRLNKMPMPKSPRPFTDAQRQKLVALAVDIYHPLNEGGINGARETYGLDSSAMKALANDLVLSIKGLLPVTGRETLTKDARGNFALSPGKSVSITYLTSNNRVMLSNGKQQEIPTFLLGTDNVPYPIYVSNSINFAQQEKEHTLKFWSEAFMWLAFGEVLKAGFVAFKLVGRAIKIAPRALKAAQVASKGKKLGRFTTKMRQGLKYGSKKGALATKGVAASEPKATHQRPPYHARNANDRPVQRGTKTTGQSQPAPAQPVSVPSANTNAGGGRGFFGSKKGEWVDYTHNPDGTVTMVYSNNGQISTEIISQKQFQKAVEKMTPDQSRAIAQYRLKQSINRTQQGVGVGSQPRQSALPKTSPRQTTTQPVGRKTSSPVRQQAQVTGPLDAKVTRAKQLAQAEPVGISFGQTSMAEPYIEVAFKDGAGNTVFERFDDIKIADLLEGKSWKTSSGVTVDQRTLSFLEDASQYDRQVRGMLGRGRQLNLPVNRAIPQKVASPVKPIGKPAVQPQKPVTPKATTPQVTKKPTKPSGTGSPTQGNTPRPTGRDVTPVEQLPAKKPTGVKPGPTAEPVAQETVLGEARLGETTLGGAEETVGKEADKIVAKQKGKQVREKERDYGRDRRKQKREAKAEEERIAEEQRQAEEALKAEEERLEKESKAKEVREKERDYGRDRRKQKREAKAEEERIAEEQRLEQERLEKESKAKEVREKERDYGRDRRKQKREAKAEEERKAEEARIKAEEAAERERLYQAQESASKAAKESMETMNQYFGKQGAYWSRGQESMFVIRDAEVSAEFTSMAEETYGKLKNLNEQIDNTYRTLNEGRFRHWDKVDADAITQMAKTAPDYTKNAVDLMSRLADELRGMEAVAEGTKAARLIEKAHTLNEEVQAVLRSAVDAGIPRAEWAKLNETLGKMTEIRKATSNAARAASNPGKLQELVGIDEKIDAVCHQGRQLEQALSDLKTELDSFKSMWGRELTAGRQAGKTAATGSAKGASAAPKGTTAPKVAKAAPTAPTAAAQPEVQFSSMAKDLMGDSGPGVQAQVRELKEHILYELQIPGNQYVASQLEEVEKELQNLQVLRQGGADAQALQNQVITLKKKCEEVWGSLHRFREGYEAYASYTVNTLDGSLGGMTSAEGAMIESMQKMENMLGMFAGEL